MIKLMMKWMIKWMTECQIKRSNYKYRGESITNKEICVFICATESSKDTNGCRIKIVSGVEAMVERWVDTDQYYTSCIHEEYEYAYESK